MTKRAKRFPRAAAFILAGGASSRMGRDKSLLEIAGEPLIVRTARLLHELVPHAIVVGAPLRYSALGLRAIPDESAVAARGEGTAPGPLAGIITALHATRAAWNLILACDLPYLSAEWAEWMLERAMKSRAHVVLPHTERGWEPLAAVYRRACAEPFAAAFARGVRKVTDAFAGLHLDIVQESEWRERDPSGRVLENMNSPEQYRQAARWWSARARSEGAARGSRRPSRERKSPAALRPRKR